MKIEINSTPEGHVNVTIETPDKFETISRKIVPSTPRPYPVIPETIGEESEPEKLEKPAVEKKCKTCGNPFTTRAYAQKQCDECKADRKKKAY